MFYKGDTIITGIDGTIEVEPPVKIPAGTKGIIYSYFKAAKGKDDVDECRIVFGFKDKAMEAWMVEWKPITTRIVLTEKIIIALTMDEFDLLRWAK